MLLPSWLKLSWFLSEDFRRSPRQFKNYRKTPDLFLVIILITETLRIYSALLTSTYCTPIWLYLKIQSAKKHVFLCHTSGARWWCTLVAKNIQRPLVFLVEKLIFSFLSFFFLSILLSFFPFFFCSFFLSFFLPSFFSYHEKFPPCNDGSHITENCCRKRRNSKICQ